MCINAKYFNLPLDVYHKNDHLSGYRYMIHTEGLLTQVYCQKNDNIGTLYYREGNFIDLENVSVVICSHLKHFV